MDEKKSGVLFPMDGIDHTRSMGFHSTWRLTDAQVDDFQKLYQKQFGISLSQEDAREKGERMIGLVHAILDASGCELE